MEVLGCFPKCLCAPVTDLYEQSSAVAGWRAGRIVAAQGRLLAVERRWLPYRASHLRIAWEKRRRPTRRITCELTYHCPIGNPEFLVVGFIRSHRLATLATFYCATLALDEIARMKGSKAIVAEVTNGRLTDRLFERWGWERHCNKWHGRHFIKRFYEGYPPLSSHWQARLRSSSSQD